MTNPELPAWPGAETVFRRLQSAAAEIGRREYAAFLARRRPRKSDRFNPSEELREMCAAIGRGDEEELKALVWLHRELAIPPGT